MTSGDIVGKRTCGIKSARNSRMVIDRIAASAGAAAPAASAESASTPPAAAGAAAPAPSGTTGTWSGLLASPQRSTALNTSSSVPTMRLPSCRIIATHGFGSVSQWSLASTAVPFLATKPRHRSRSSVAPHLNAEARDSHTLSTLMCLLIVVSHACRSPFVPHSAVHGSIVAASEFVRLIHPVYRNCSAFLNSRTSTPGSLTTPASSVSAAPLSRMSRKNGDATASTHRCAFTRSPLSSSISTSLIRPDSSSAYMRWHASLGLSIVSLACGGAGKPAAAMTPAPDTPALAPTAVTPPSNRSPRRRDRDGY
mmetsp:Transcript_4271/g.15745  ORF Transcript_4271/g.15745 Transcript_4271/m.15745 type:complete len:310 (+) Transcript_4271:766-1695(+)